MSFFCVCYVFTNKLHSQKQNPFPTASCARFSINKATCACACLYSIAELIIPTRITNSSTDRKRHTRSVCGTFPHIVCEWVHPTNAEPDRLSTATMSAKTTTTPLIVTVKKEPVSSDEIKVRVHDVLIVHAMVDNRAHTVQTSNSCTTEYAWMDKIAYHTLLVTRWRRDRRPH